MSVQSHQKKKRRECHTKMIRDHDTFLERITKTLYYSNLPTTDRLSLPLTELAVELYSEAKLGKSLERLRIEEASEISLNACISPCSFVLAVIYLEQLKTSNPGYVDRMVPSDLFLVSLMIATKFLNDTGEDGDVLNSEWATSANLTLSELNQLEKEFLEAIEWNVFVKEDEFYRKLRSIETIIALSEGARRKWFSYTELEALLHQFNSFLLAKTVFMVSAVCIASYTAGILTVIGTTIVATQLVSTPQQQMSSSTLYYSSSRNPISLPVLPGNTSDTIANNTLERCHNWVSEVKLDMEDSLISMNEQEFELLPKENYSEYSNSFFIQPQYFYTAHLRNHPHLRLIS